MENNYLKNILSWGFIVILMVTVIQSSVVWAKEDLSKTIGDNTPPPETIKRLSLSENTGTVINRSKLSHKNGHAPEKQTSRTPLINLAKAKQIALENNPSLAAARERVIQAQEAIAQARAAYLPTLSTTSAWNYTENTNTFPSIYSENLYSNKISATQLLFDGFLRKYTTLAATYGEKMSLAAQQDAQRLLAWSVAQSFLSVQLARENIKIAESDMAFNQAQEKVALAREKTGTGSLSDLLNFKTRVNTANASLINAQQDFKESCHGLAALMGYATAQFPPDMVIGPLDIQDISTGTGEKNNKRMKTAAPSDLDRFLTQRPDLLQAEYAVKAAGAQINVATSGYYPTVTLTGSYGLSTGEAFRDMGNTDKMGTAVGITVNFELFSGGATKSRVREAISAKKELEKNLESSKLSAMSELTSAADDIITTQRQLALQRKNTSLARQMRDLVKKEYNAGQASLVRLNEAQNELVQSSGALAIARISLILAQERFDYYAGRNQ